MVHTIIYMRNAESLLSSVPVGISIVVHIGLILSLFLLGQTGTSANQVIQINIVSNQQEIMKAIDMTKRKGPAGQEKEGLARSSKGSVRKKVFGVSMESVIIGEAGQGDVVLPVGDTLMKTPDKNPVSLYDLTEGPVLIKEVKAPYPPEALQRGIEGKVILELLIDSQGHVASARVIRGAGYGFDEAAAEAVREFLFRPAWLKGQAVPVRITYTYTFILD